MMYAEFHAADNYIVISILRGPQSRLIRCTPFDSIENCSTAKLLVKAAPF
jgi:hypothetical protein